MNRAIYRPDRPSIREIEEAVLRARVEPLEAETFLSARAQRDLNEMKMRGSEKERLRLAYQAGYRRGNDEGFLFAKVATAMLLLGAFFAALN